MRHSSAREMARVCANPKGTLRPGYGWLTDARTPQHAVRDACPCRASRTVAPSRRDVAGLAVPSLVLGALDLVAILGGRVHRFERVQACRVRRTSTNGSARFVF